MNTQTRSGVHGPLPGPWRPDLLTVIKDISQSSHAWYFEKLFNLSSLILDPFCCCSSYKTPGFFFSPHLQHELSPSKSILGFDVPHTLWYQQKGFVGKSKSLLFAVVLALLTSRVQMTPRDCSGIAQCHLSSSGEA